MKKRGYYGVAFYEPKFETTHCVNMAAAASITIYDRHLKLYEKNN